MPKENYLKPKDYSDDVAAYIYREIILKYELKLAKSKKTYRIKKLDKMFGEEELRICVDDFVKEDNKIKDKIRMQLKNDSLVLGETPANFIYCKHSKRNWVISIFAHIRNSFVHGLVKRVKIGDKTYYLLEDIYRKNTNMIAQINQDIFRELIKRLVKTEEKKKPSKQVKTT